MTFLQYLLALSAISAIPVGGLCLYELYYKYIKTPDGSFEQYLEEDEMEEEVGEND